MNGVTQTRRSAPSRGRRRRHQCTAPRPTLRRGRCRAGTGTAVLEASGYRGSVLLWPDTFTNCLNPAVAQAAIELLEDADGESCYPPRWSCVAG